MFCRYALPLPPSPPPSPPNPPNTLSPHPPHPANVSFVMGGIRGRNRGGYGQGSASLRSHWKRKIECKNLKIECKNLKNKCKNLKTKDKRQKVGALPSSSLAGHSRHPSQKVETPVGQALPPFPDCSKNQKPSRLPLLCLSSHSFDRFRGTLIYRTNFLM